MGSALSSGVSGLQAHQKMLDVAGNNLANVNTPAFKSSSITFSELLSETLRKSSQPSENIGGTNPQQMGTGVGVSSITRNITQGNIVKTGNPLDMAIEGRGYFVLSDGTQNLFTRAGTFAIDAANYLVDPSTGYRVQRIGSVGESDGFQAVGNSNIQIPFDAAVPARATSEIVVGGNLSSDGTLSTPSTQVITSNFTFTANEETAELTTQLDELDQFTGTLTAGRITIGGFNPDGTALAAGLTFNITGTTTIGDLIAHLNDNVLDGATASLISGKIRITDDVSGYSRSDISMSYADTNGDATTLKLPSYFEMTSVGGEEVKNASITVYDSQGNSHVLTAAFVRTNTANKWDMVLNSMSGNIAELTIDNRRIDGLTFSPADGSFLGLTGTDTAKFVVTFGHDASNPQTINVNLGTAGELDGLTQFAGSSTAVARDQDGYEAGKLSTVSVNKEGVLIGAFSNGIKKDLAVLQIALFKNETGLESVGGGYFASSANSGEPVATQGLASGAGSVHGSSLEKSNADVATEFVNLIQAQNGFQANARTISVANDILRELTNLIR